MIERYTRPEMGALWSEDARYRFWLQVELAVCEVLCERGVIPGDAMAEIRARADFDTERIAEIEREVRHDVIAFLTNVAEYVGPSSRFIHYGMTSSDVLDTALALQIRAAGAVLRAGLDRVLAKETGLPVVVAEDPLSCVVLGTGRCLEEMTALKTLLIAVH